MKKIYYYLIGLILFIISLIFDRQISIFFTGYKLGILDVISLFVHNISGYVLFGIVFLIILLSKQHKKLIPLILAFLLYLGLTGLLKIIIARPRPFIGLNNSMVSDVNPYRSFPSGHATAVFTLIPFFDFNKILYYAWIFIAVIVSLSRVYLGVHYLSDVVFGALLGIFIADLVPYLLKCYNRKVYKHLLTLK